MAERRRVRSDGRTTVGRVRTAGHVPAPQPARHAPGRSTGARPPLS